MQVKDMTEQSAFFPLPYHGKGEKNKAYLILSGGYSTFDVGCPAWGTNQSNKAIYFGDLLGTVRITYASGAKAEIPLVFGYTMWCLGHWKNPIYGSPFKGNYVEPDMQQKLLATLHLKGAFEAQEEWQLCLKLKNEPVESVEIEKNQEKPGEPVFRGAFFAGPEAAESDEFFLNHTINCENPYPKWVCDNIGAMRRRLLTFEDDFYTAPKYHVPEGKTAAKIEFSGTPLADIATGVVHENITHLKGRVLADGFITTSYAEAPSWLYDGYEMWADKMGSYHDAYYSRDGARAILTLAAFGETAEAERAACCANRWMMYYPENGLKINGKDVLGHFSVIVNKPLVYSTFLSEHGWPTQYTKERFGEGYQSLGNQETDGHGLMMMANYLVWKNLGAAPEWVAENWRYIKEAANWILWCFENPGESFAKNGLLYAESEAGMNDYTMYCNLSCYLGMRGYCEMAEAAGKAAELSAWTACADNMFSAIDEQFAAGNKWNLAKKGFYHDPMPAFFSDIYGPDAASFMPRAWFCRSENTFSNDFCAYPVNGTHFGPMGLSYDHSLITQNAMLLDRTADYDKLLCNLTKVCYAPRLPEPYLIPECFSVDTQAGVYRRQGDLGNLVQLADGLKCYLLACGVDVVRDGVLTIMPRLPKNWRMSFENQDVIVRTGHPKNDSQAAKITPKRALKQIKMRFGPFDLHKNYLATQNGEPCGLKTVRQGDALWAWVTIEPAAPGDTTEISIKSFS